MSAANILHSSNSNSWYTPSQYIEAARKVFGGYIDLDPASDELANATVQAELFFTEEMDGLRQYWFSSNIWVNPPYGKTLGRSNQDVWSEKLVREYHAGHFKQAILLINAVTDRKWFQRLWVYPICFTDHRIRFYNAEGVGNSPTHGNAFVYLGPDNDKFIEVFREFGMVVMATPSNTKNGQVVLW